MYDTKVEKTLKSNLFITWFSKSSNLDKVVKCALFWSLYMVCKIALIHPFFNTQFNPPSCKNGLTRKIWFLYTRVYAAKTLPFFNTTTSFQPLIRIPPTVHILYFHIEEYFYGIPLAVSLRGRGREWGTCARLYGTKIWSMIWRIFSYLVGGWVQL